MAGYCTLVLYFHSPAARENTTAHSCNIQPYCPLTHQIIYMYMCKGLSSSLGDLRCTCVCASPM